MNGARGEVTVRIAGKPRRLCLTLGALAEMETALGAAGLDDLVGRMRTLSARHLLAVLAALLRGGGEKALADNLADTSVDPRDAADAVARAFLAAAE
ncbi:MAG: gene transfer agent family protein [Brevundimonas sp.]|nr:MAG: gene transfer agent family protein [Brevundimonas sp.]